MIDDRMHQMIESQSMLELERTWIDCYSAWYQREIAAAWFIRHYRARAEAVGVFTVAKQLRKQGVPCDISVALLATR